VRPARSVAPSAQNDGLGRAHCATPSAPPQHDPDHCSRTVEKARAADKARGPDKVRAGQITRARGTAPARVEWIGLVRGAASRTPCAPSAARAPTRRAQRAPRARGLEETCLCASAGGCGSPRRARLSHQSWRPNLFCPTPAVTCRLGTLPFLPLPRSAWKFITTTDVFYHDVRVRTEVNFSGKCILRQLLCFSICKFRKKTDVCFLFLLFLFSHWAHRRSG
jgi:hypothetical protein